MNRISFAGTVDKTEEKLCKCFELFAPASKGKITYTLGGDNGVLEFSADAIIVIPPLCRYSVSAGGLSVNIEQAVLPTKTVTVLRDDTAGGIRHAMKQAASYQNSEIPKKELVLSALGNLLAGYVAALGNNGSYSPVVLQVMSEISKNLSDSTFPLDGYMKKLPLNYDYVRKLFKKEVGATPHEYLVSKRMELAAELLASGISNSYSNYSVSQVSEACGFAEPLYFSRVFKKYYGVAPSAYSKSLC